MNDPDIQLWCEDEVHFQRHSSLTRMWSPKGQQPHVFSASTRQKVGFFGALNLKTGCLLTKEASTFNVATFSDFISYVFQHTEGKIYLILDNASWHKAVDLRDFFINNRGPPGAYFSAALFPRTQSYRTGVEGHSPTGHPQPLFRINPGTHNGIDLLFRKMGATK